ncbi:MAG: type I methionyl aminopeptidase [Alphaproteobacteria bacterium]|nr:type I methionyl aminopeptidase [Alphaproteobacteria bacterium]
MSEHFEDKIKIYGQDAIEPMEKAGKLAARVLDFITPYVKVGVSTGELDKMMHEYIIDNGATPAPLNYRGYPKATCISINHVICHGIPDFNRFLKATDMLNIDVTVVLDGWYGDTSRMFYADEKKAPVKAKKLTEITYECLYRGIDMVKSGNTFGDIGYAIQNYAESQGCSVVRDFVGHGIGRNFHEAPNVFHYGKKGQGKELKEGMIFTIEPMINLGGYEAKILDDGWTAVTRDKSLSAQAEHTLMVVKDGCKIFTESEKGFTKPPYN